MHTHTEENYLKTIYKLTQTQKAVNTNAIADEMQTKASSVTDMLKKLAEKKLVHYVKYQGASLTEKGKHAAIMIVRKHRLWEVFLVSELGFGWDEIHQLAEQLEHIRSDELVNRLDAYLGHPKHDPHGDPIPDKNGHLEPHQNILLVDLQKGQKGRILGLKEDTPSFLQLLDHNQLGIGTTITVLGVQDFDNSMLLMANELKFTLTEQAAANLYIALEAD